MGPLRWAQNRLERSLYNDSSDVVLQQGRFWARSITWTLMAVTGFGLGWLALARTEEIVTVQGKLEPLGVVKEVQMPVGGVVDDVLVKEGQLVQKGQVLLRLDTEASRDRQQTISKAIAYKEQQLVLKQEELTRYLATNDTEQQVLSQQLVLQQEVLRRLEVLNREGATAELQYLQQKNTVQEVQGNLERAQVDRLRQQAILQQGIRELQSELADLRSKLIELNVNLRYQVIRAPERGFVFELKPKSRGFVAQTSEPVMKVVPIDKLEARVEIPSDKRGFVSVGQMADVSIDSFPATDFGVLQGKVRRIGSDALPPDQLKTFYRFPADVQLAAESVQVCPDEVIGDVCFRTPKGQSLPLEVGMSLTANIKLRKVTYLQLLLSDFKDKADSLRRL
ncbi:MAG: HlyD family efflux transporter periplasmic adaptor subunit [Cyanobacteriota bacterium]|jgi:HlyD family secretion protein|nr:HlyD family efflux transporter periplasmic adaptor subunit [Cyanobacteriota bacterium]